MTTNLFEDVVVRTTKFGDLPVLHVFAASQAQTKLPTIIDYHGWTNQTATELGTAYQLVRAGFESFSRQRIYMAVEMMGLISIGILNIFGRLLDIQLRNFHN